jgi:hypothetical protein
MMFEIKMAKPAKKMPSFLILRDLFVVRDSYTLRHHTSQLCVDAVAIAIAIATHRCSICLCAGLIPTVPYKPLEANPLD